MPTGKCIAKVLCCSTSRDVFPNIVLLRICVVRDLCRSGSVLLRSGVAHDLYPLDPEYVLTRLKTCRPQELRCAEIVLLMVCVALDLCCV